MEEPSGATGEEEAPPGAESNAVVETRQRLKYY